METKNLNEKLSQKRLFKKGDVYSTRVISQRVKPTKNEVSTGAFRLALMNHADWEHFKDRSFKYLGSLESPVSDQMQLPLEQPDDYQDKVLNQVKGIIQYLEETEDISKNSYITIRRKLLVILHILNIK